MSAGGSPLQLISFLQNMSDQQILNNPDLLDTYGRMVDAVAKSIEGYDVVSTEQNLAGFADVGDQVKTLRGRSDLILKKKGQKGVRISDIKSVAGALPNTPSGQYIAQLMAYGYAYNQMRDDIRQKDMSYEDFAKSDRNKLYAKMMGETLNKDLYNLMKSDEGELEELALNYVNSNGSVKTFVAN